MLTGEGWPHPVAVCRHRWRRCGGDAPGVRLRDAAIFAIALIIKGVVPGMRIAEAKPDMAIAQITKPGLAAIGVAVAMLWACAVGERVMVRRAVVDRTRVMLEVQRMHQHPRPEPVSSPSPFRARRPQQVTG